MKITPIRLNMTELELPNGDTVLFSYSTPVAARIGGAFFRTERNWSKTTQLHINQWLCGATAEAKPQEYFDTLATTTK